MGIGTAPAALVAHGIRTTTIEIDPVVQEFAKKYFELPQNHTSVTGDAIEVVSDMRKAKGMRNTFDYIIHDVFTGGAEPINLFTREFILGLSDLLRPDGVIAIVRTTETATDDSTARTFQLTKPELCWRSASPNRRLGRSHRRIRLSKVPLIPRISTTKGSKGDGLHQHGHVLQKGSR